MPMAVGPKLEQLIARKIEARAARQMERAGFLRERAVKSTLERSPEVEVFEKNNAANIVEPEKESFFSRLMQKFRKRPKKKSPIERAKEINAELTARLEKTENQKGYSARPMYSGEEILNIVEVNKSDPELAIRLAKRFENKNVYNDAAELFDMAKSEPKMFAAVKNHIPPESAKNLEVLNNLQHVSAENVKRFPVKLVQKLEKAGAESRKPVDEVFKQPVLREFVDSYGERAFFEEDVKKVSDLVKTAAENPVETERFLTKVNEKSNEVYKAAKNPLGTFHIAEVTELVKLHQENPKVVEAIIDKFGLVKPTEIRVLVEYDKRGINVDKYVREFLKGNPYNRLGDMEAYIKFRLKSGSVFSNMLKGKSDEEISEFYVKQLGKNRNNLDALERLERYGFKPESEEEMENLIEICNRYPDMKITKEFVNEVSKKKN